MSQRAGQDWLLGEALSALQEARELIQLIAIGGSDESIYTVRTISDISRLVLEVQQLQHGGTCRGQFGFEPAWLNSSAWASENSPA